MRRELTIPLVFKIKGRRTELIFSSNVLQHWEQHRQLRKASTEAGGQLFANFGESSLTVAQATGPYRTDIRSRCGFTPDRKKEHIDVKKMFSRDLHFIGNWHTHPEDSPTLSPLDIKNTRDRYLLSDHQLEAFVLVIVGKFKFPDGLWVSLVSASGHRRLRLK